MKAGRELDALVAEKVMGLNAEEMREFHKGALDTFYSTDIAAAWEVVENFNKTMPESWSFSLFGSGTDWHVEIDSNNGRFMQNGPTVQVLERADTAPLAICLAALQAVGVDLP